jgi:hypothetical protein
MRVPDPFSCLFNVAASRAQIATTEAEVSTPAGESQWNGTPPAPFLPQLRPVTHADLSGSRNGSGYLKRY